MAKSAALFEWEKVENATGYVIEIYQNKKIIESKQTESTEFSLKLEPGRYEWRVKSLDKRKVSGPWSEFDQISILEKNINFRIEKEGNDYKIKTVSPVKKIIVNEEVYSKNLNLKVGLNQLEIEAFGENFDYEKKKISYEVFGEKIDHPKNVRFWRNKIFWDSSFKKFVVKIDNKIFNVNQQFIEFKSNKKSSISIKAISENKYYPDSDWTLYFFDPDKENAYQAPKFYVYLDNQISKLNYEHLNPDANEKINFSNISAKSTLGLSYEKIIKISGDISFGSIKVNGQNLNFVNKSVNLGYGFKIGEYLSIYPQIGFFSFENFKINSGSYQKESLNEGVLSFLSYYSDRPVDQFEFQISKSNNFHKIELGYNYRLSKDWRAGLLIGNENFKSTNTEESFNNLKLRFIFDLN